MTVLGDAGIMVHTLFADTPTLEAIDLHNLPVTYLMDATIAHPAVQSVAAASSSSSIATSSTSSTVSRREPSASGASSSGASMSRAGHSGTPGPTVQQLGVSLAASSAPDITTYPKEGNSLYLARLPFIAAATAANAAAAEEQLQKHEQNRRWQNAGVAAMTLGAAATAVAVALVRR